MSECGALPYLIWCFHLHTINTPSQPTIFIPITYLVTPNLLHLVGLKLHVYIYCNFLPNPLSTFQVSQLCTSCLLIIPQLSTTISLARQLTPAVHHNPSSYINDLFIFPHKFILPHYTSQTNLFFMWYKIIQR